MAAIRFPLPLEGLEISGVRVSDGKPFRGPHAREATFFPSGRGSRRPQSHACHPPRVTRRG